MTNEEAIKIMSQMIKDEEEFLSDNTVEAHKMAIKALEQQPCEDCISRQAAKRALEDRFMELQKRHDDKRYETNYCLNTILELPSATPQQKYGKWIVHPEIETSTPEYLMFYECSECGDKQCFCKSDIHKKRFCSNCGAKMQERG